MLESGHDHERQQAIRLAVGLGDEERHDRHLGDVELEVAHHALELRGDAALELREVEAVGARLELLRDRVIAEQGLELHAGSLNSLRALSSKIILRCAAFSQPNPSIIGRMSS